MYSSVFVAAATTLVLARAQVARAAGVPAQAQVINQRKFNALETVQPPAVFNISGVSAKPYTLTFPHAVPRV